MWPLCPDSVVPSQNCIYSALIIKIFLLYYGILSHNQFKHTNVISPGLPIVIKVQKLIHKIFIEGLLCTRLCARAGFFVFVFVF